MALKEQLEKDLGDLTKAYRELLENTQRHIGAIAYVQDLLQKIDADEAAQFAANAEQQAAKAKKAPKATNGTAPPVPIVVGPEITVIEPTAGDPADI